MSAVEQLLKAVDEAALQGDDAVLATVVKVEGSPVSGWVYDETNNAVVFDTAFAPANGEQIEISYVIPAEC